LALTGVAGPMTQEGKPVGTVYAAAVLGHREPLCREFRFEGVAGAVRLQAVLAAADLGLQLASAD
jgi:nicotinamide-nucleotide amidase